jgi:hypothetical protein
VLDETSFLVGKQREEREKEKGKKLVLSKKGKKMNPLLKLNSKDDERVFLKREMNYTVWYIILVIVVFIMNSN